MKVALGAGTALVAALALTAPAGAACIKLGVYQDNVAKTLVPLSKAVGPGIKTVSVYVTAGTGLDPQLITLANSKKLTILVSWMPDKGKDGPAGQVVLAVRHREGQVRRRSARARRTARHPEEGADRASDARAEHAVVRVVGRRRGQHAGRVRQGVEARPQRAAQGRSQGAAAVGAVCAERARHPAEHDRLVLPGRQERRPRRRRAPRTSARRRVSPGRRRSTSSRRRTRRSRASRRSRSGSPRPARPPRAATSAAGSSRSARCTPRCPGSPASCGST